MRSLVRIALAASIGWTLALGGCEWEDDDEDEDFTWAVDVEPDPNASEHTDEQIGVGHGSGKDNPLENCASCHGAALEGDLGPSCYDCHTNLDHDVSREGVSHMAGAPEACVDCHGPGNNGGIGPSCDDCHD